jgi:hypothetical protein
MQYELLFKGQQKLFSFVSITPLFSNFYIFFSRKIEERVTDKCI